MRWKGNWRERKRRRVRKSDRLLSWHSHLIGVVRDVLSMALSGHYGSDDLLPLYSIPCTLRTGIHLILVLQTACPRGGCRVSVPQFFLGAKCWHPLPMAAVLYIKNVLAVKKEGIDQKS